MDKQSEAGPSGLCKKNYSKKRKLSLEFVLQELMQSDGSDLEASVSSLDSFIDVNNDDDESDATDTIMEISTGSNPAPVTTETIMQNYVSNPAPVTTETIVQNSTVCNPAPVIITGRGTGPARRRGSGPARGRGTGPARGRGTGSARGRGTGPARGRGTGPARGRGTGPARGRGTGQARGRGTARRKSDFELGWREALETEDIHQIPEFSAISGIQNRQINVEATPYDIFSLFFDDFIFHSIKTQTNKYARDKLVKLIRENGPLQKTSIFYHWKGVSNSEIKIFFSVIIHMALVVKPTIKHYWSKKSLYYSPFCKKIGMSRDRFMAILTMLHMADNSLQKPAGHPEYDALHKVRIIHDNLLDKFHNFYVCKENLTLDEGMVPFRGGYISKFISRESLTNMESRFIWFVRLTLDTAHILKCILEQFQLVYCLKTITMLIH